MPSISDFEEVNFDKGISNSRWITEIGSAISQTLNVLIFRGDSNYSISSDTYRLGKESRRKLLDWLFSKVESEHCKKSYYYDLAKARRFIYLHELTPVGRALAEMKDRQDRQQEEG